MYETNYDGFCKELLQRLASSAARLNSVQAKCRNVLTGEVLLDNLESRPRQSIFAEQAAPPYVSIAQAFPESPMQVPSRKRPTFALADDASDAFPQSPVQMPSRKRPPLPTRDSSSESLSTLELVAFEIDGWGDAPQAGNPQSPISFPSRLRPPGADDGWGGAPSQTFCPQSPVSVPSRRMPFGVRAPSRADSSSGCAPAVALDGIVHLLVEDPVEDSSWGAESQL